MVALPSSYRAPDVLTPSISPSTDLLPFFLALPVLSKLWTFLLLLICFLTNPSLRIHKGCDYLSSHKTVSSFHFGRIIVIL